TNGDGLISFIGDRRAGVQAFGRSGSTRHEQEHEHEEEHDPNAGTPERLKSDLGLRFGRPAGLSFPLARVVRAVQVKLTPRVRPTGPTPLSLPRPAGSVGSE